MRPRLRNLLRFLSRPANALGLLIVGFFFFLAIAAPQIAPAVKRDLQSGYALSGRVTDQVPHPPSAGAPLGTLPGQYNVYTNLVWGTRSALAFGLVVALVTSTFGVFVGALSGYLGGRIGRLIMHITDGFLAVPVIVGIVLFQQMIFIAMSGTEFSFDPMKTDLNAGPLTPFQEFALHLDPVLPALILLSWMPYARLTYAMVGEVRQAMFVEAARAVGVKPLRIITRHVIPNTISPAVVMAARDVGAAVLLQATFTFIGMGNGSDWGNLLVLGRKFIIGPGGNPLLHWWVFVPVTLTLVLFGIGWNLLGDGLNEALNPRQGSS